VQTRRGLRTSVRRRQCTAKEKGSAPHSSKATPSRKRLAEFTTRLDAKEITPQVATVLPFADVRSAYEMIERHEHPIGRKIVLTVP
jgi:NADPH:quinone reductase-like Zn-dependent oxidoreductase